MFLEIINHGEIREIRLNRPPVNALNTAMVQSLNTALQLAASESRAVVISGTEGMFSAGLDVPALLQLDRSGMREFWNAFTGLLETVAKMPIPTVGAISGHSPAGGTVICLFCDYRVMTNGLFKIGLNETRVGLMLPSFIHRAMVRLLGAHRAERLIVAGALISPRQALEVGLVDELADDYSTTLATAVAWCDAHLSLPPMAMKTNRESLRASLTGLFSEAGENQEEAFLDVWFSAETQETLIKLVQNLRK